MEQLIKIKDSKIQSLVSKLQQAGLAWILPSLYFLIPLSFLQKYLSSSRNLIQSQKHINLKSLNLPLLSLELYLIVVYSYIHIILLIPWGLPNYILGLLILNFFLSILALEQLIIEYPIIAFEHLPNKVINGASSFKLISPSILVNQMTDQSFLHTINTHLYLIFIINPWLVPIVL